MTSDNEGWQGAAVASAEEAPGPPVVEAFRARADLPLEDYVTALSPERARPAHLSSWCRAWDRVEAGGARELCAVPVRHWKTWTTLHGVARCLERHPSWRFILMAADHDRAMELGKECRRLCTTANVGPERGQNTIVDWKNDRGGGVCVMSAKQSALGRDVDVLVFDDPVGEHDWDDVGVCDDVDQAIAHYTARSMRGGKPGSTLGLMSRFHPVHDPIARRLSRTAVSWNYVHARAINDDGSAFAPEVWSAEELLKVRAELAEIDPTERLWWAQFQNEPRSESAELFREPARYTDPPTWPGFRDAIGIDMATSTKRAADWFALVRCRFYGGQAFVLETQRFKADPGEAMTRVRAARANEEPVWSYMSGPEMGIARYFEDYGVPVNVMGARYDKRTRAQKTIDRWNDSRVLLPEHGPWVRPFIARARAFNGAEGGDDAEIDALVSVCDGMIGTGVAGAATRGFGSPRF